jgi:hypothetical protein
MLPPHGIESSTAIVHGPLHCPEVHVYNQFQQSGSSSVVECFLAKEDVAGSTPVSRSKQYPSTLHFLCINGLQEFLGL